ARAAADASPDRARTLPRAVERARARTVRRARRTGATGRRNQFRLGCVRGAGLMGVLLEEVEMKHPGFLGGSRTRRRLGGGRCCEDGSPEEVSVGVAWAGGAAGARVGPADPSGRSGLRCPP